MATKPGSGGHIHLTVGTGDVGDGGNVKRHSGSTTKIASITNPFKLVKSKGGSI